MDRELGNQPGHERGAIRQCVDVHVFVKGMRAVADGAKAVERRNPECRGEIPVIPKCFRRTARSSGVGAELLVRNMKGVPLETSAETKPAAPGINWNGDMNPGVNPGVASKSG